MNKIQSIVIIAVATLILACSSSSSVGNQTAAATEEPTPEAPKITVLNYSRFSSAST